MPLLGHFVETRDFRRLDGAMAPAPGRALTLSYKQLIIKWLLADAKCLGAALRRSDLEQKKSTPRLSTYFSTAMPGCRTGNFSRIMVAICLPGKRILPGRGRAVEMLYCGGWTGLVVLGWVVPV